jgi:hypothetical protein
VRSAAFTPGQRRVLVVMILLVVVVFAALAGFIVTSLQSQSPSPIATPPPTLLPPTSTPQTPMPSPAPTEVGEGIWSQVQAARLLDQIERQVETLRGLSPRAEVPLNFLDERGMSTLLRRLYVERTPEARLLPYAALGLLPDASISIEPRLAVGVYVPDQEQLYVATGEQAIGADDRVLLLAYTYSHVLQDQYFDLQATRDRAATTDARLAVEALIEGDATLLTALYHSQDLATTDWLHVESLVLQAEQPSYGEELDDNETWGRLQVFPYREGRRFVEALFQSGGWEVVNHAYADPPRSTELVLHPERYLAEERDLPTVVFVPELSGTLGVSWTLHLRDTLGEFALGLYLAQTLPEEAVWPAADGWDGDTLVVWEHEDGDRVRVWRTIWDTTAEAAEFERALVTVVPQRFVPTRPVDPPSGLPGRWWGTDAGVVCVYRVARYVTWVDAPDVDTLVDVVEALP